MKKIQISVKTLLVATAFFGVSSIATAQNVGINASGATPDASAALDVSASDKGMLVPRVALTATTDVATITTPATSLLVYNTATAGDVTPGYYYFDGTIWQRMVSGTIVGTDDQNITGSGLAGTTLTIGIEGGTNETVDLSSLQDGTGTDSQTLSLSGSTLSISGGNNVTLTDNVNDADADATNELQTISKTGTTVTLSNGGGSFTDVDTDTQLTEAQVDAFANNNGYLTSFTEVDGSVTNEIQALSISGNTVSLSNGGGSVAIPSSADGDAWAVTGEDITSATGRTGNVGIGTTSPSAKLDVEGTFQLVDGTQGSGKVLTSDANGNASWQPLNGVNLSVASFNVPPYPGGGVTTTGTFTDINFGVVNYSVTGYIGVGVGSHKTVDVVYNYASPLPFNIGGFIPTGTPSNCGSCPDNFVASTTSFSGTTSITLRVTRVDSEDAYAAGFVINGLFLH